ncbi:uncharacterized protein [Nicotiana tomentosiformis]|uniref:uncharacterized protein isoform X2 n=2 Tax=Nicotiana tomentosiformis TaxID=4098 RepID=UPI00051BE1D3
MQTEARVGVVVDGGGSGGSGGCGRGAVVVDGGASRKLITQQRRQQSQIGTVPQLLAGGVAGAVSKTCTAPLARLTILFQVQGMHADAGSLKKASIWQEASRIVREEGYRAFWKGNLVTIAHRLPYSSISFYAFERYKNVLQLILGVESQGENITADLCIRLVGGGLSGITAASVTYPLDLVRTRLAAQRNVIYYRGIWHALQTISREEGIAGLYKGMGATLLGVGPNLAISFSVYDTVRSYWQSRSSQVCPSAHSSQDSTILTHLFISDQKTQPSWSALLVEVFQVLHHQQRSRLRCWLLTKYLTGLTLRARAQAPLSGILEFSKEAHPNKKKIACLSFSH